MTLTNRLSLFVLTALAIVLAGFSFALYLLVHFHLYAQLDERLDAAMKALVTAIEIHPRDVQWEPLERRIVIGEDIGTDQPRWVLHDQAGNLRDRSANIGIETTSETQGPHSWRVLSRRVRAGNFTAEAISGKEHPHWIASLMQSSLGDTSKIELPQDRTVTSDALVFTVAFSEGPVVAMLRWLAFVLFSVSTVIWVTAALWGRWLCRRALSPIGLMAASARSIRRESEPAQMLEVPATRDELADLGEAFNELLADLRDSFERQRQFTGDASHQLRTPLTAMLASVEVALRHDRTPLEYKRVLEIVVRRGGQLRQIIESLLFLARSEGSSQIGIPEQIDLNDWCELWLGAWKEHPRFVDMIYRPAPSPAVVSALPFLLAQILDNLLDNATKYSEPGTPICVSVETQPKHATIVVSDSGCGIAADQHAQIFEPFFRTADARWQGKTGVGLGLTLVQRLAGILGANVEVSSEPGKGSRFTIHGLKCIDLKAASEVSQGEDAATVQIGKAGEA